MRRLLGDNAGALGTGGEAIKSLRVLVQAPSDLDEAGLKAALSDDHWRVAEVYKLCIPGKTVLARHFTAEVDFDNLPEVSALSQKICAYRFVQEGLSNAFRHGRSTTPRVAASGDTELEICVSDDGCGFDLSTVSDKSLGLNGMRARVQALGGRFNVSSELGHGTTVIAKLRIQE